MKLSYFQNLDKIITQIHTFKSKLIMIHENLKVYEWSIIHIFIL